MELTCTEMEKVSAGTVEEMNEMIRTASKNAALKVIGSIGSYLPGGNKALRSMLTAMLRALKIHADISLGFAGTGLFQGPNKYTSMVDGHEMSHQEVLERLGSGK